MSVELIPRVNPFKLGMTLEHGKFGKENAAELGIFLLPCGTLQ